MGLLARLFGSGGEDRLTMDRIEIENTRAAILAVELRTHAAALRSAADKMAVAHGIDRRSHPRGETDTA